MGSSVSAFPYDATVSDFCAPDPVDVAVDPPQAASKPDAAGRPRPVSSALLSSVRRASGRSASADGIWLCGAVGSFVISLSFDMGLTSPPQRSRRPARESTPGRARFCCFCHAMGLSPTQLTRRRDNKLAHYPESRVGT